MLLLLHLIHPSPNSSPPPPPAPLIPPPQTPQNPHLTQPLQHNETAQNRGTDAGKQGSSYQKQAAALPACGRGLPWSAPRALPWSLHGARNGTPLSPVTHSAKVRPTRQTRQTRPTRLTREIVRWTTAEGSQGARERLGRGMQGA
jgi:hypothetical protein